MKERIVRTEDSVDCILCSTIVGLGGQKLLAKGHRVTQEDVRALEIKGVTQVPVVQLEDGEVSEEGAVMPVATNMACGSIEVRLAGGGRANLFATESCCILVDGEALMRVNCADIAIATLLNFSFAVAGQRVATVKSVPLAVSESLLETIITILKDGGPILQGRPIRDPSVGVIYTDLKSGQKARETFEGIMAQRLERLGVSVGFALASVETEGSIASSLRHMLNATPAPTCILIASSTAPAGPGDAIGKAMLAAGFQIECFMAPVEPGNLLLLGYKDDVPVVSAPGCFRSAKPNVLDVILPAILARYRISRLDIVSLAHGGLLA